MLDDRLLRFGLCFVLLAALACGSAGSEDVPALTGSAPSDPSDSAGASPGLDAGAGAGSDGGVGDAAEPAPACTPSTNTWPSLVAGPGQAGFDPTLAEKVGRYDRLHDALFVGATGLAGSLTVKTDPILRQKVAQLLATPWAANDADPTDDLQQYAGLDPMTFVTSWGMATGMYAGSELAADAYRYGVLRDRGGSCNDRERTRKVLQRGLDALHVVVTIPGYPGAIARAIARKDLPGDGQAPLTPILDAANQPLPAEKNNGTWRADRSTGLAYPQYVWMDSCSRDMLFGWTLAMAAAWEVIALDPAYDAATKARLRADAKSVLDGLRIVRPGGKDLELWDPEGRRTFHGNLHETSVDRQYALKNGVASMMALGEVAALVSIVDDAPARAYLSTLLTTRGLPQATAESMFVLALGGDSSNHSAFNMLFLTAWLANRYVADASARATLRGALQGVYAPLLDENPSSWRQSFFDFAAVASSSGSWVGGSASKSFDAAAVERGLSSLRDFPAAPFYPETVENCDAGEVGLGRCLLNDGVTFVKLSSEAAGLVADKPVPMKHRPPSNFFWRTNPFLVNGPGGAGALFPGSDLRMAYWLARWVRVTP